MKTKLLLLLFALTINSLIAQNSSINKVGVKNKPVSGLKEDTLSFPKMILIPGGEFEYHEKIIGKPCTISLKKTLLDSFYVSETLISVDQFSQFLKSNNRKLFHEYKCDQKKVAITAITWGEMAQYCNWLSEKEGMTPYYRIDYQKYDDSGVVDVQTNKNSKGYRLIDYVEYEFISRYDDRKGLDIDDEKVTAFKPVCSYLIKKELPNKLGVYDLKNCMLEYSNTTFLFPDPLNNPGKNVLHVLHLGTRLSQQSYSEIQLDRGRFDGGIYGFRVVKGR